MLAPRPCGACACKGCRRLVCLLLAGWSRGAAVMRPWCGAARKSLRY